VLPKSFQPFRAVFICWSADKGQDRREWVRTKGGVADEWRVTRRLNLIIGITNEYAVSRRIHQGIYCDKGGGGGKHRSQIIPRNTKCIQWLLIIQNRTRRNVTAYIQWNLYKAEPHGTENIFHIGQIFALYKINNTDSSGRDYRICSHWANFRLIQVPPYTSFTVHCRVRGTVTGRYEEDITPYLPLSFTFMSCAAYCTVKIEAIFHSETSAGFQRTVRRLFLRR
jgi:hypothetical protein